MQHELALHPPTSGAGRHRRERRRRRGRAAEEATDVIGGEVAPTQTRHERLPRGEGRRTQSVQRGASPLGYRSAGRATFGRRFSCGSRCRHASRLAGSVRPCRKLSTGPGRPRRVVTVESPELGGFRSRLATPRASDAQAWEFRTQRPRSVPNASERTRQQPVPQVTVVGGNVELTASSSSLSTFDTETQQVTMHL